MVKKATLIVYLPKNTTICLVCFGDLPQKPILSVSASGVARHNTNKNE